MAARAEISLTYDDADPKNKVWCARLGSKDSNSLAAYHKDSAMALIKLGILIRETRVLNNVDPIKDNEKDSKPKPYGV